MDSLIPFLTAAIYSKTPTFMFEVYESLIWKDKYDERGDFQLTVKADKDLIIKLIQSPGLYLPESGRSMIVEKFDVVSKLGELDKLVIRGRSIEHVLDSRVIWPMKSIEGTPQDIIYTLIQENFIDAGIYRSYSNFIFQPSMDPDILDLPSIKMQYAGETVYKAVEDLCKRFGLGFKMTVNNLNNMVFELYVGQSKPLMFSFKNENLITSTITERVYVTKNSGYVAGEGEPPNRKFGYLNYLLGGSIRNEAFIDAGDVVSNFNGTTLTPGEYSALLQNRGYSELTNLAEPSISYTGEIDASKLKYGLDYTVGDTINIQSEYKGVFSAFISEVILSKDRDSVNVVPTCLFL